MIVYPTFDLLGALFHKPRGRSCEAVHKLLPILEQSIGRKYELSVQRVGSVEEFVQRFTAVTGVMIVVWNAPCDVPTSPTASDNTIHIHVSDIRQTARKA